MGGEGFEPSKALPADLQSVPFGHSGIHPYLPEQGFLLVHRDYITQMCPLQVFFYIIPALR